MSGLAQLPQAPTQCSLVLQGDTLKVQHFAGALLLSPPGTLAQPAKPREPCLSFPRKGALKPLSPKIESLP